MNTPPLSPHGTVSRPLFIEEHGLRLLLDHDGVGVELSRQSYEAGDWGSAVSEALSKGAEMKAKKRWDMEHGIRVGKREEEGKRLATEVLGWMKAHDCAVPGIHNGREFVSFDALCLDFIIRWAWIGPLLLLTGIIITCI